MITRRKALIAAPAIAVAGCTPQQVQVTEATIAAAIAAVQQGVASACKVVGIAIPTATSIIALLGGGLGATSIAAAVTAITGAVCPPAAAGAGAQGPLKSPPAVVVNGVTIGFVQF